MPLHVYLMRHGETLFNTRRVEQGFCDSPLTEEGIRQAQCARLYFEKNHIFFDARYASTLERACDTMEIITDQPYVRRHDLKEINLGTMEAVSVDKEPSYPYGDYYVQFGGEGLEAFRKRIFRAMKDIAEMEYDLNPDRTVLVVSHGMAMRQFLNQINGPDQVPSNCGIARILFDDAGFHFMELIDPLQDQNEETENRDA